MELINIIREAPDMVALVILLAWNFSLQQQIKDLQARLDRVSSRAEAVRDKLFAKMTDTDLGE